MAWTASAIYGACVLDGAVESFLPGEPKFSLAPVVVAVFVFATLVTVGPRIPRRGLALLGPVGVALISLALAATPGPGDGAVLYALPVLWTTAFFGRRGAIAIISCVGIGHAVTLVVLPASSSYPGRWLDVMVSVCSIAVVILALERRNEMLVERLAGEARTDPLTGLLNRRGFHERAAIELAHTKREHRRVAVATFDIDYFKRINDEWGHETGDRVLTRFGQLLESERREIDVAARLGGEEFTVLLPGSNDADAYAFTQRVRRALTESGSDLPTIRVSAGLVTSDKAPSIEALLQGADSALYASKRSGRDRTTIGALDKIVADSQPAQPTETSVR